MNRYLLNFWNTVEQKQSWLKIELFRVNINKDFAKRNIFISKTYSIKYILFYDISYFHLRWQVIIKSCNFNYILDIIEFSLMIKDDIHIKEFFLFNGIMLFLIFWLTDFLTNLESQFLSLFLFFLFSGFGLFSFLKLFTINSKYISLCNYKPL